MNPKKLSIGNHVLYKGREVELTGEDFLQLVEDIEAGIIKGIPLTDESFSGWSLSEKGRNKNGSKVARYKLGGSFMLMWKDGVLELNRAKTKIKFVHELENLVLGLDFIN